MDWGPVSKSAPISLLRMAHLATLFCASGVALESTIQLASMCRTTTTKINPAVSVAAAMISVRSQKLGADRREQLLGDLTLVSLVVRVV